MILMHLLRALSDLGLYYAFAGTVAGALGASMVLVTLLVQSGCFALSAVLRRGRWVRLAALAPAAGLLLLPGVGWADRAVSLPGLAYLAYLAWRGEYGLRWGRQADVFSLLWKAFLPFAPVSAVFGCQRSVVSHGFPLFLTAAAASVLLLRSLRHAPEVYCRQSYQIRNWLAVGGLLVCAYLASTDWFLGALGFVYGRVVMPVLLGITMAVGIVCMVAVPLAVRLVQWVIAKLFRTGWELPSIAEEGRSQFDQVREMVGVGGDFGGEILAALGILAALLAVILLFRWLVRRRVGPESDTDLQGERRAVPEEPPPARQTVLPATCAGRVRGQYRRFLKLCRKKGLELSPSDTSAQVSAKAARRTAETESLAALEEIYRRARYSGRATREDLAEAKRLYGKLKRSME